MTASSSGSMRTLLCYGDSNTHGTLPMNELGESLRLDASERWPGVVRSAIGTDWTVLEEGLPGRTTVHDGPIEGAYKNGAVGLDIVLHTHKPIDVLIIMLGTNDLKQRFSKPASDIALSIKKLIEIVRGSLTGRDGGSPSILIVAPPPITESGVLATMFGGGTEKSPGLAGVYQTVANQLGCAFLNAGDHVTASPVDGVHFDAPEHGRLGTAIAAKANEMTSSWS